VFSKAQGGEGTLEMEICSTDGSANLIFTHGSSGLRNTNSDTNSDTDSSECRLGCGQLQFNRWMHVAVVRTTSPDTRIRFYVNAKLVATCESGTDVPVHTPHAMMIGAAQDPDKEDSVVRSFHGCVCLLCSSWVDDAVAGPTRLTLFFLLFSFFNCFFFFFYLSEMFDLRFYGSDLSTHEISTIKESAAPPIDDCAELQRQRPDVPSGRHVLRQGTSKEIQVYCDMDMNEGGWTLVSKHSITSFYYFSWCCLASTVCTYFVENNVLLFFVIPPPPKFYRSITSTVVRASLIKWRTTCSATSSWKQRPPCTTATSCSKSQLFQAQVPVPQPRCTTQQISSTFSPYSTTICCDRRTRFCSSTKIFVRIHPTLKHAPHTKKIHSCHLLRLRIKK